MEMRQDGKVEFYQYQMYHQYNDTWSYINPCTSHDTDYKLWRQHTASGDCWQKWGFFGFYYEAKAIDALPIVRRYMQKHHPTYKYRLALVKIEMSHSPIIQCEASEEASKKD